MLCNMCLKGIVGNCVAGCGECCRGLGILQITPDCGSMPLSSTVAWQRRRGMRQELICGVWIGTKQSDDGKVGETVGSHNHKQE